MIEVKNLTKRYDGFLAVDNLSFTVEDGQVYGFLGPNGAGKSTTMNIITGCLAASEGTVTIDGYDIFEQPIQAKKQIGYLPEIPPLYTDMTPREYLSFVAAAKGVKKKDIPDEVKRVVGITSLQDVQNKLIKSLSKGYCQRVGIAQALLGDPKVIILDEPTVGLDPVQIIEIRELIKSLSENKTVILSSHILAEVSAVCKKILIISKGKLVAMDSPENLMKSYAGDKRIVVTVRAADKDKALETIKGIEGVDECTAENGEDEQSAIITIGTKDEDTFREKLAVALMNAQCPVLSMSVTQTSLEDVFLEVTGNENHHIDEIADADDGGTDDEYDSADTEAADDEYDEDADDGEQDDDEQEADTDDSDI